MSSEWLTYEAWKLKTLMERYELYIKALTILVVLTFNPYVALKPEAHAFHFIMYGKKVSSEL